jgi:hypothetical protein
MLLGRAEDAAMKPITTKTKIDKEAYQRESDLYAIMATVQALVDEMLPPDDDGCQDHTPAILEKMQGVQDAVSDVLGVPRRALIAPDF